MNRVNTHQKGEVENQNTNNQEVEKTKKNR